MAMLGPSSSLFPNFARIESDFNRLASDMMQPFGPDFSNLGFTSFPMTFPTFEMPDMGIQVDEKPHAVVYQIPVPQGLTAKDLHCQVKSKSSSSPFGHPTLTVYSRTDYHSSQGRKEPKGKGLYEEGQSQFYQQISLPDNGIRLKEGQFKLNNGVFTATFPKDEHHAPFFIPFPKNGKQLDTWV